MINSVLHGGKVWQRECLVNLLFQAFGGISFAMNRSAKGLLIVITTLDVFSLVNHRQFAKFTKLYIH